MPFDQAAFIEVWNESLRQARPARTKPVHEEWEGRIIYPVLERNGLLEQIFFKAEGDRPWRMIHLFGHFDKLFNMYEDITAIFDHRESLRIKRIQPLKVALQHLNAVLKNRFPYSETLLRTIEAARTGLRREIRRVEQRITKEVWFRGLAALRPEIQDTVRAPIHHRDFESWFQIALGWALVNYFGENSESVNKLGITNLSRLIFLFYLAAGLAVKAGNNNNHCIITRTKKALTRQGIEQNLHRRKFRNHVFQIPQTNRK